MGDDPPQLNEPPQRNEPPQQEEQPQRCFLLQRFEDLTEVPILKTNKDGKKVFAHYAALIAGRVAKSVTTATVDFQTTDIGPLIVTFGAAFPASELPFNGGIEAFKFDGYDYRFDAFGANTVRTLMDAELLHSQGLCKPLMCSNHTCFNYCGALDEFTFVPPLALFARLAATPHDPEMRVCDILEGDAVYDGAGVTESMIADDTPPLGHVARATSVLLDEYVIELEDAPLPRISGDVIIHGARWELFPVPSDASRLDMHLAQISSLDTKYAQRFTREVRHMDEVKEAPPRAVAPRDTSEDAEAELQDSLFETDSDTESYVESALIPGLRHRDFNKPISTATALAGLTLDESTHARVLAALNG